MRRRGPARALASQPRLTPRSPAARGAHGPNLAPSSPLQPAQPAPPTCTAAAGVELTLEWGGELAGKQTEFFLVDAEGKTLLRSVELTLSTGLQWRGNSIYRRA